MAITDSSIFTVKNTTFPSNTYLIKDTGSNDCIIIDPGLDVEKTETAITDNKLKPIAIFATHGHFDHIAGVAQLKTKYGVPFYMPKEDLKLSRSANFYLKLTKINYFIPNVEVDHLIEGESTDITLKSFTVKFLHFPGHSNGSYVIQINQALFSGDIIYKKGLGFNNFPGENINLLRKSILRLFTTFGENTPVYPGHGDSELLGNIQKHNLELNGFLKQENG